MKNNPNPSEQPDGVAGGSLQQLVRHPVEDDIIKELYQRKAKHELTHAYVTTTIPLPMHRWSGKHPVDENSVTDMIPAGSTLKIVMVSRMGDCGLTDNLDAENGYGLRLNWDSGAMTNIRWDRMPNKKAQARLEQPEA